MTRLRQFVLVVPGEPTGEQIEFLLNANDDACIETDPPSGEAWISFDREAPSPLISLPIRSQPSR